MRLKMMEGRPDRQIAVAMVGLALLWAGLGWWVSL